jgi:hypothetical protein
MVMRYLVWQRSQTDLLMTMQAQLAATVDLSGATVGAGLR